MRLFTRYNRLNLLSTVVIFILTSISYYFLLRYVIVSQLDDDLKIEKEEIIHYVGKYQKLPEVIPVKEQVISFEPVKLASRDRLQTVNGFDSIEQEKSEFRKLYFTFPIKDRFYQAMVGKSMEGTENLIQSIVIITLCTVLLILAASLIINRLVLSKLWKPFYNSLSLIREYRLGRSEMFYLPKTDIEEFSFMNTVFKEATTKADRDFLILKEFTENASHEMQTPLAIIRSKLDLLIQDENISEHHGDNLQVLYEGVQKLTRLNKSLLLLTKIENRQFDEKTSIEIDGKLKDKLTAFQEIIRNKSLSLTVDLQPATVIMNPDLLDLLLNNLLSNAIKHNYHGGSLSISLGSGGELRISNTGAAKALDQEKVFTRFYKERQNNDDTGLGLSIIKEICTVSGAAVRYNFANELHTFTVRWNAI